jgi:hypothetical protein
MPYAYSRARKRFNADIEGLLITTREAESPLCASSRVRGLAHGSAVLLASAKVESYLEDLILDWGQAINSNGVLSGDLPRHTRAFLLNGSAIKAAYRKLLLLEHGEKTFLDLIGQHLEPTGEYRFANETTPVSSNSIGLVLKDVKYPSEENLNRLFFRCGISAIFTSLNTLAKRDVLPLLRSFNDVRTELAHEGLPVGLNGKDVRQRIKGISAVVGYIDRAFYKHTIKLLGPNSWTT